MILKPIIPVYIIIVMLALIIITMIICGANKKYRNSSNFIRLGILALLSVALLRPIVPFEAKVNTTKSNTVLYFILDNTSSMGVEDEVDKKSRVKALSEDMQKIINKFEAPSVGIFTQDVLTYRMMPVSSDIKTALEIAKNLGPKNTSSSEGTDLNKLIKEAANYINSYTSSNKNAKVVVFIMSDGENALNGEQEYELSNGDFNSVAYGAVIGYGSAKGGEIPIYGAYMDTDEGVMMYRKVVNNPYITDENNKNVISKIDEKFLTNTANIYGFKYVKSSNGIDQMINEAKDTHSSTIEFNDTYDLSRAFETYWIFTMLAGVLILIEFYRDFNGLLSEREVKK